MKKDKQKQLSIQSWARILVGLLLVVFAAFYSLDVSSQTKSVESPTKE